SECIPLVYRPHLATPMQIARVGASGGGKAAGGPVHRADHSTKRGPHDRLADPDAPVDPVADLDLEVSGRLGVAAGGERVLGIVEHPDPDSAKAQVERRQRVAEGGDGTIADAGQLVLGAERPDGRLDPLGTVLAAGGEADELEGARGE